VARSRTRRDVQLHSPRASRVSGPSAAPDPGHGGYGLGWAVGECAGLYPKIGRPSIPPEKLLRGLLLQLPFSSWSIRISAVDYSHVVRRQLRTGALRFRLRAPHVIGCTSCDAGSGAA